MSNLRVSQFDMSASSNPQSNAHAFYLIEMAFLQGHEMKQLSTLKASESIKRSDTTNFLVLLERQTGHVEQVYSVNSECYFS